VQRLHSARLQADVMGCDLVIVARTDAHSATYLESNIDPVDHPFILGCVDPKDFSKLMTFPEAGKIAIASTFEGQEKERVLDVWGKLCYGLSLSQA